MLTIVLLPAALILLCVVVLGGLVLLPILVPVVLVGLGIALIAWAC